MNNLLNDLEMLAHAARNTVCKIGKAPDPVRVMNSEINKAYVDDLNGSRPSDMIICDLETSSKLISLWKPGFMEDIEKSFEDIPSDLFFGGHVPLMDMIIEFNVQLGEHLRDNFVARIFIYPDFHDRIKNASETGAVDVGIVSFSLAGKTDKSLFTVLAVVKGHGYIFRSKEKGHRGFSLNELSNDDTSVTISEEGLNRRINIIMNVWYGVQIALLNPLTKDVFMHGKPVPMNNAISNNNHQKDKKKKKKVVRYIKKHVINPDELDMNLNVSTSSDKKYTRKTMTWYVIGHWRNSKNGKKTFIKGYWKGPLKDIKNTEVREREIVTV